QLGQSRPRLDHTGEVGVGVCASGCASGWRSVCRTLGFVGESGGRLSVYGAEGHLPPPFFGGVSPDPTRASKARRIGSVRFGHAATTCARSGSVVVGAPDSAPSCSGSVVSSTNSRAVRIPPSPL